MTKQLPALHVDQLSVHYDKTPVLWDITLSIEPGQLVAIVGPNGAGKSTLIKSVLELVTTLSGRIEFFGKPLKEIRGKVAYVPQRESVDWDFPITVRDLVLMGSYGRLGLFRRPGHRERQNVDHYLELVDMKPNANRQISQLSGGQQQRVFLARALMQNAEIYFLDEPFAGIDMASEAVLMRILKDLAAKGKTVFIVHHDLSNIESYFDSVILLNTRLVACGAVRDVFNSQNLIKTYGKSYPLLSEALKLSQNQTSGLA